MTNKTNTIVMVVISAVWTFWCLNGGIGGLMAGFSISYLVGTLVTPILLWVVTIYCYRKYQRDKKKKV